MQTRIPAAPMRGGTSKGLYFLASDLPADPLTGKVAIGLLAAVERSGVPR